MSNLIKANYIYFEQGDKRVINSDVRYNDFVPLIPKEIKESQNIQVSSGEKEFVEGMNILNMDKLMQTQRESIEQQAQTIIEDAKAQAENIRQEAVYEVELLKREAYEKAKAKGYIDGITEGEISINQLKVELQDKITENERNYEKQIANLEPNFVDIMISFIEKITGIMIEDKKEVILFLVDKAIKQEEKSNQFIVRVSKDDYLFMESEKEKLLAGVSKDAKIIFEEDKTLVKNQCIIETDTKIIDCSLDVQLKSLTEDLKLLSRI